MVRRRHLLAWAAALCLWPAGGSWALEAKYAPGELIVQYKEEARVVAAEAASPFERRHRLKSRKRLIQELEAQGPDIKDRAGFLAHLKKRERRRRPRRAGWESVPNLHNLYRLVFEDSSADMRTLAREYARDPRVLYAHPNYALQGASVPNDPSYAQQWAHQKMMSEAGWTLEQGAAGVVIAVVDTGVDWNHPDLAGNIWANAGEIAGNGVDDDGNGYVDDVRGWNFVDVANGAPFATGEDVSSPNNNPMDFHGHGTLVAGVAAAVGDNNRGVAGLSWHSKIMPLRVGITEKDTGNAYILVSWVANAIYYAANNGADVVNLSLTDPGWPDTMKTAIDYAYDQGAVIVAAAGNAGDPGPAYPAAYTDKVIGVASTDENDQRALWTSPQPPFYQSASSNYGTWVGVAAPGSGILSTAFNDVYEAADGTSISAAFVSGLAALIRSRRPAFTPAQVMKVIASTTDRVSSDKYIGTGRINVLKALQMSAVPLAQITAPFAEQTIGANFDVQGSAGGADFASYTLMYGQGLYPASWTTIASGAAPVASGSLGVWNVAGVMDNRVYTLRLSAADSAGNASVSEVVVYVQKNVLAGWPQGLGGKILGDGVAIGDLNGSGQLKIAALAKRSTGGGAFTEDLYVLNADGSPALGWPVMGIEQFNQAPGAPALADLDRDGKLEVIVSGYTSGFPTVTSFRAYDRTGNPMPGWPQTFSGAGFVSASPSVGDLDGDGGPEIVFPSRKAADARTAMISIYHADGSPLAGWPKTIDLQFPLFTTSSQDQASHACLVDLDADGKPEIVVGLGFYLNAKLYAFHQDGTVMAGWPVTMPDAFVPAPVAGDLNNDGGVKIVATSPNGKIYVYNANGSAVAGWPPAGLTGNSATPPVLADLDGDGDLEIVTRTSAEKVFAFRPDGTALPGWPVSVEANPGTGQWPAAVVGDIDGDRLPEVVQASGDETQLYAWHADGSVVSGWPKAMPQATTVSPALGDLTGGGGLTLAFAYDDTINVLALGAYRREDQRWPMAWFDQGHTASFFAPDVTAPTVAFSAPADGATVLGAVAVTGTASDAGGLSRVQLAVDGGAFTQVSGVAPWSHTLNTLSLANGAHTLKARATDLAGNFGEQTISVTVANPSADGAPPTVTLVSPADGQSVGGSLEATIAGSDNVSVVRVELWADGAAVAAAVFSPALPSFNRALSWKVPTGGAHTLQAKAYDAVGNIGASAAVSVVAAAGSRVSLVRGGQSVGDSDARGLKLSLKRGERQALTFSDDVQEAAILDSQGRVFQRRGKSGGAITMVLQQAGDGGVRLSSGLWLVQMKDSSGRYSVAPLIVVK